MDLEISTSEVKKRFAALDELEASISPWNNAKEGGERWNSATSSMQGQD